MLVNCPGCHNVTEKSSTSVFKSCLLRPSFFYNISCSLLSHRVVKHQQNWNIFLKFLGEVKPVLYKNNLRIILGSKSEKFENIEAQKIFRHSYNRKTKQELIFCVVNAKVHQKAVL